MRHLTAALAALGAVVALAAGPSAATAASRAAEARCWDGRLDRASRYAATREGTIAFAVIDTHGIPHAVAGRQSFLTASLLKTLLLLAYLRQSDVRDRPLRADERALLDPLIRRSDNAAASFLVGRLGTARIDAAARAAGMRDFALVLPIWGLSRTSAIDQARLFRRLDGLLPDRHRRYARSLLRRIVPSQRWGLPHGIPAGWTLLFKGGWGSGSGRVTSQAGRLEREGAMLSVAVMTEHDPSLAYGAATIAAVARRLLGPQPCGG